MMKFCLGTVQQGMDYGINGKKAPSPEAAAALLETAWRAGIRAFDTAEAYGMAESVIGRFIQRGVDIRSHIQIVTKLKPNCLDGVAAEDYRAVISRRLGASLEKMGVDQIDGYLAHSSRYIFNDDIMRALYSMKETGRIKNAGVSVYSAEEALKAAGSPYVDYIQIPYNIFDRRLDSTDFFERAKKAGKTIFARSCFLQGLLLMAPEDIPDKLEAARPLTAKFRSAIGGVPPYEVCVSQVKKHPGIDYIVVGVRDARQLSMDYAAFNATDSHGALIADLENMFQDIDHAIVMPSLWAK
jgi:aryl-alcohol dehydrogenase-like predicted oxidoreductase